ncbi:hypothetical protein [uncultured Nostoc sp.]|jgi:hypothetical protein
MNLAVFIQGFFVLGLIFYGFYSSNTRPSRETITPIRTDRVYKEADW